MFFLTFASLLTSQPHPQGGVALNSDGATSCDDEESSIDEHQPLLPKAPRSDVQAVHTNEGSSV